MCVCMNVYVYTRNAGAFGGMAGGSMSHDRPGGSVFGDSLIGLFLSLARSSARALSLYICVCVRVCVCVCVCAGEWVYISVSIPRACIQ